MTVCPGCGAPLDVYATKCLYCDRPILDLNGVDFNGRPFILKAKIGDNVLLAEVICQDTTLTMSIGSELPSIDTSFCVVGKVTKEVKDE